MTDEMERLTKATAEAEEFMSKAPYLCYDLAKELIDAAKAPTIGGWISVKDRLPEKYGHYLVIRDNGFMSVDTWTRHSHWGKAVCKITHWMPLPSVEGLDET